MMKKNQPEKVPGEPEGRKKNGGNCAKESIDPERQHEIRQKRA